MVCCCKPGSGVGGGWTTSCASLSDELEDEYTLDFCVKFGFDSENDDTFGAVFDEEGIPAIIPGPGGSMLLRRGGYCSWPLR